MHYLKRGILSIVRKPMKTVILFLVIFILGNLMSGAVSIKKSINNTEDTINKSVRPITTITLDNDALLEATKDITDDKELEDFFQEIQFINLDTVKIIAELPYVKYYDYNSFGSFRTREYKNYYGEEQKMYSSDEDNTFSLKGVQYPKVMDIEEGIISLVEGRVFTEEEIVAGKNYAIVGDEFAKLNDLTVGSTIHFSEEARDWSAVAEGEMAIDYEDLPIIGTIEREIEIIGIFNVNEKPAMENQTQEQKEMEKWSFYEKQQQIYTTNGFIEEYNKEMESIMIENGSTDFSSGFQNYYEPIYVLKENTMLDDFRDDAGALIPEYFKIQDTTDSLGNIKASMEKLNNISNIVLYVAIGVSILILSLLTTLFLHDRRHEIGIYMAMGERKIRIIGQIFVEVMVVAIVAMSVSLLSGNFVAKGLSKDMLLNQADLSTDEMSSSNGLGISDYQSNYTVEDVADTYRVSLDGGMSILFYSVSTATIAVSTIVPILYVLRLKPKEILM